MILYINTTQNHVIEIAIKKGKNLLAKKKLSARYAQAEKLLPLINKILQENRLNLKNIKKIQVNNLNGSFTALRIGVVTANTLGYALGVPVEGETKREKLKIKNKKFDVIKPIYSKEPNITVQ
jgi:tRNA threonylcarbamoyladenosine biosynthesis protein TsaB